MTDFYSVLELDRSLGTTQLLDELNQLERVWIKRQITKPEKATEMLALIYKARDVFATDQTRAAYDRELEQSKQAPVQEDPDAARKQSFEKWYNDAVSFMQNKEDDLAQVAIEKAISYMDPESEDASVYHVAAVIYRLGNDYPTALRYVNKAIINDPTAAPYYLTKGLIFNNQYTQMYNSSRRQPEELARLVREERAAFQNALQKATASQDTESKGLALGGLGWSYYFHDPVDLVQGEDLARQAAEIGDAWGNAQKVLDSVQEKRTAQEKAEEEERLRKEKLAEEERLRKEKAEKEEQERLAKIAAKKRARRRRIIGFFVFVLAAAAGLYGYLYFHTQKIGSHVKWKYDADTATLTVSGNGDTRSYPDGLILGMGLCYAPWNSRYNHYSEIVDTLIPPKVSSSEVQHLVIEEGITSIGRELFKYMPITEVTIPESVERIEYCAFEGCDSLAEIRIPATIRSIHSSAFIITGLERVEYGGTLEDWASVDKQYIGSFDENYDFSTCGAGAVECTDGRLYSLEDYYRTVGHAVDYYGTMEAWNAIAAGKKTGNIKKVCCTDGTIDYDAEW